MRRKILNVKIKKFLIYLFIVVIDAHLQEIPNFIWDEKKKILITASLDKGIKMWQLPLSWPSELVRRYKQKNERRILLNSIHAQNKISREENEDEKLEEEKNEKIFETFEMKNLDEKENNNELDKENNNNNEGENRNRLDQEFDLDKNKPDKITDDEDDDFLIGQKLKKMIELTEREKNCEDLHGWDEDPQF